MGEHINEPVRPLLRILVLQLLALFFLTSGLESANAQTNGESLNTVARPADQSTPRMIVGGKREGKIEVVIFDEGGSKLDCVALWNMKNVSSTLPADVRGEDSVRFVITIIDTSLQAGFCLEAWDAAANYSGLRCQTYEPLVILDVGEAHTLKLSLWPHPAQEWIRIEGLSAQPEHARIIDALGRTVWHGVLNAIQNSIAISELPAGRYHVLLGNGRRLLPLQVAR